MRAICIGDTHIDNYSRWDEQVRLLDWQVEEFTRQKPDLILHTGDLFERRPNRDERAAAAEWLGRLGNIAPVLCVNGNHSPPESLIPLDSRFPSEKLADMLGWAPGMVSPVTSRHPVLVEPAAGVHVIGGCAIAALGWPSRARLLDATEMANEWAQQVGHHDMQNLLRMFGMRLQEHEGPRLFIGHATITGARTQTGFEALGTDFEISLADLSLASADAYVLGHIHDAELNRWEIGEAPVTYTGASRHCNWGEMGPCYYVLVDIDQSVCGCCHGYQRGKCGACNNRGQVSLEYVPIPAAPMMSVECDWVADGAYFSLNGDQFCPEQIPSVAGSEVRFQFNVEPEHREAARRAAMEVEADLLASGAIAVTLQPVPKVVTRARAPEVGTATEIDDKLRALWKAQQNVPEPPVEARLVAKVAELESALPDDYRGKSHGAVIPEQIVLHEMGPYRHAELDLTKIPGPVVAVVGEPGSGKTTLFELGILGAIDCDTLNSGSLKDRAKSRESYVETRFRYAGAPLVLKQSRDTHTDLGTSEAKLNGSPALTAAGIKEYKAWRQSHLPSTAILRATIFSAQQINKGTGAFLSMRDAERIDVILEATGCGYLEQMAKLARSRATAASEALALATQRLADEREHGGDVGAAEKALAEVRQFLDLDRAALEQSRRMLAEGEATLRQFKTDQDDYIRKVAERGKLASAIRERSEEIGGLDVTIHDHREIVAARDRIRAAQKRAAELAAEQSTIKAAREGLKAEEKAAGDALETLDATAAEVKAQGTQWKNAGLRAREQLARKPEVEQAVASIPGLEEAVRSASEALRTREHERQTAEDLAREMAALEAQARADEKLIGPAQYRMEQATESLKERPLLEEARERLPGLEKERTELQTALDAAEAELERLRGMRADSADERAGYLGAGLVEAHYTLGFCAESDSLDGVRETSRAAQELTQSFLDADAEADRLAKELPAAIARQAAEVKRMRDRLGTKIAEIGVAQRQADRASKLAETETALREATDEYLGATARAKEARARIARENASIKLTQARGGVVQAKKAQEDAAGELARARETAALADTMAAAEKTLAEATEKVEGLLVRWREIQAERKSKLDRMNALAADLDKLDDQESSLDSELCGLSDLLALVEKLAAAEGNIRTCEEQKATAQAARSRLEAELQASPLPQPPDEPEVDLRSLQVAVQTDTRSVELQTAEVGKAEKALEHARASAQRAAEYAAEVDRQTTDLGDWNRLAKDLGRTGVQALEIDCAGPELTDWANYYLSFWGPRFRVRIDTQRPHSSEDRMIETCAVTVFDSRDGLAREGRTFSGGETAILSRALTLALGSMACERARLEDAVLFEDESTSSLSDDYCEVYLRMIRAAIERTRASKIIMISHQKAIQDAADSRIFVKYDEATRQSTLEVAA